MDEKQRLRAFAPRLAALLGGTYDPEQKPARAEWKRIVSMVDSQVGGAFLDFGHGGGAGDDLFDAALEGPLRKVIDDEVHALGYFKLRLSDKGTRLEVHAMVPNWHEGAAAAEPFVPGRIALTLALQRAAMPGGWSPGEDHRVTSEGNRSAMAWRWDDWRPVASGDAGLDTLAEQVARDVRDIRPRLVAAVKPTA